MRCLVKVLNSMSENQNPEQKARDTIDALLKQAGWVVQSSKKIDLNAGIDVFMPFLYVFYGKFVHSS